MRKVEIVDDWVNLYGDEGPYSVPNFIALKHRKIYGGSYYPNRLGLVALYDNIGSWLKVH